jgi:hypothetical protein
MDTTQRWQDHPRIMDMTQMIINDYLSHEVRANAARVRFFLHVEYKLDRSQIDQVINILMKSKFVHVESYFDGSQTFFLKPRLEAVSFAHSCLPQSWYIK